MKAVVDELIEGAGCLELDVAHLFFASKAFVRYKTMNIVVHKDAIPAAIKAKLGIESSASKDTKKGKKK